MKPTIVTAANATELQTRVLKKPLEKLLNCLSEPANLGVTLNRLFFDYLGQGGTFLPDESQNLNALFDFVLACTATKREVTTGATILIGEA
ncbi:MAG: hypothetical protein ACRYFX_09760 [Janthinobacterium lividum]